MNAGRNSDTLAQVAHYIIARTPPEMLGATKLNKVLWFVDCYAYRKWGKSLTGLTNYTRLKNGPVPDGLHEALRELKADGKVIEEPQITPVGTRREFISIQEPDLSHMTAEQVDLIHRVIEAIRPFSAQGVSNLTHDALWEELADGASMSVAAGSVRPEPMSDDAWRWALGEAQRIDA